MPGLTVEDVNRRLQALQELPPPELEAPTEFSIEDINRRLGALPDIPALPKPEALPVELSIDEVNARLASLPEESGVGLLGSVGRAVPRGALDIAATSLELPALSRRRAVTTVSGFVEQARRAREGSDQEHVDLLRNISRSEIPAALKAELTNAARDVRAGRREPGEVRSAGFGANLAEKAAAGIRGFGEKTFPIPPEHEQRLPVQVARGLGSVGAFLTTRLLPGGQVLLPGFAGLAGGGEAIERAAAAGASDEAQARVALQGSVAGLTDIVPIERLLRPIANIPGVKGALYGIARKAVEQGLIESTQEGVQQFMQNAIARLHTPGQDLAAGIREVGLVGFLVGTLFGGGAGGVQVARRPALTPERVEPRLLPAEPGLEASAETVLEPVAEPAPATPIAPDPVPEAPQPRAPAPSAAEAVGKAKTGQPFAVELHRGAGREARGATYSGAAIPILGNAKYWTPDLKAAQTFGPEIETAAVTLRNPLVIDSDTVWRALTKRAGWRFPNPFGLPTEEVQANVSALQEQVRAMGHDGVIVRIDAETKRGASDKGKLLRNVFGDDQVVTFDPAPSTTTPEPTPEPTPTAAAPAGKLSVQEIIERLDSARASRPAATPGELSVEDVNARLAAVRGAPPGDQFVGFIGDQPTAQPGMKAEEAPMRREDVLRPLLTALGVPLYQGRIKGKRRLGFYRPGVEEVRIKRMNDLEVTAHELAHLLDDRIPEIRKQWYPASNANKVIRDELRGVSYDKKKLFEGFAEFVRLWTTQPEKAKAAAPHFFGWFEDFVARSEYGPAFRKAQTDMTAWFGQDALQRARSKIGVTEEINAGLTNVWDGFRQSVADDLHGIMQMERSLRGELVPVGAYETARLVRGKSALIEGALLYGAPKVKPDGSHIFVGKGLQQILDPVAARLDDFLMYAVGRSARELKAQGRERLFTPGEIKAMTALETTEFRRAFSEYQDWNRAILDFAQAKGVIDPAARAMWARTQYLPFHRVGQPGAFSPVPGDWKGIKALTGGTDNLRDVLGNMIGNASMLIDAALVNEARVEVAKLSQQPGGARFMAKIPKEQRTVRVHFSEIERVILDALGVKLKAALPIEMQKFIDQIVDNLGGFVSLSQPGQTPFGGNVVAALRRGKPEYYEVADPVLYRALVALKRPVRSNPLMRGLMMMRRLGQASITLSLDFLGANLARDTLMGSIMSRHGFKPFLDSARGMASRVTADQNYRDFIANGGGFSSYLVDEDAFRVHLERFYRSKGIDYKTVLDSPRKLLFALERIADAVEMSTRLGEFRRATRRGEHLRHAAYSGREVSTDFGMRGDSQALGFFYDTAIFLKATVNGLDRYYRGLAHDPNRAGIARRTAMLALLSMGLYALNRDNPLYDDLEDWQKDTHWHFYIPTPETIQAWADGRELPPLEERYEHFMYPKIWEIGSIASIAERTLEGFLDAQPAEAAGHTLDIIRDLFRVEVIPQAVAPTAEVFWMNRNRFLGLPIETKAMEQLQPWARARRGTSRTIRKLGEATRGLPPEAQISPAKVEALLRGYFNTWASYGLLLSDSMMFDDMPDLRVDRYPGIRRFYAREPARRSRAVTQLYEMAVAATQARKTMRHMDRTYRPEIAAELEYSRENLLYKQLSRARKHLGVFKKEMDQITWARTLDDVRELATERRRATKSRALINNAKLSGAWNDAGALKMLLQDDLFRERNAYARDVMADVEARKKVGLR